MTMFGATPIYCPKRLLDVSPESGWQDDGLYVVQYDERDGRRILVLDNIKVRTKKGETLDLGTCQLQVLGGLNSEDGRDLAHQLAEIFGPGGAVPEHGELVRGKRGGVRRF